MYEEILGGDVPVPSCENRMDGGDVMSGIDPLNMAPSHHHDDVMRSITREGDRERGRRIIYTAVDSFRCAVTSLIKTRI